MSQINIHVTPEFERALRRLMKLRGIQSKSEAIRLAVREAADRAAGMTQAPTLGRLRGMGTGAAQNPSPRFQSDDDLWA